MIPIQMLSILLTLSSPCAVEGSLQEATRRPLEHEDCLRWRALTGAQLSRTGTWALWELRPPDKGDGELRARELDGEREHVVARGASARFDFDERLVLCRVDPEREAVLAAEKEKKKEAERPKAALGILDLESGELVRVERVSSFAVPEEGGGWVAYKHFEEAKKKGPEKPEPEAGEPEAKAEEEKEEKKKKDKKDGTRLVLRDLAGGSWRAFEHATEYTFNEDGSRLVFVISSKDGTGDGVYLVEPGGEELIEVLAGEGHYKSLRFDESGTRLAFLTDRDDYQAEEPTWALYLWTADTGAAQKLAAKGTEGVPEGWSVSPSRNLRFSESGARILFGTAPIPEPEPEEVPADERVTLDVWSWTDGFIQPQQLRRLEQERRRSYLAVALLSENPPRVVQLANERIPEAYLAAKGDSPWALGVSSLPYRRMTSWDTDAPQDVYLARVAEGEWSLRIEACPGRPSQSLGGKYLSWWDAEQRAWMVMDVEGGEARNASRGIPHPVHYELHDTPSHPRSYGTGGWLAEDAGLLVYDKHDLWLVDPRHPEHPRSITEGVGRREDLRFRRIPLDREEPTIDPSAPMLLSAFHHRDKSAGFWRDRVEGEGAPDMLIMMARSFSPPIKAKDADRVRFTRSSFEEFPDLWVSDLDFAEPMRISHANPCQDEYLWGSAELVEWTSSDGTALQGILYKPEGFDPSRKYPLLSYFYERSSDRMHSHHTPVPGGSSIRYPFYTSRGYLVFVPDIPYKTGYPGQSAEHSVVSGILSLIDEGFVDPEAIGIQGHSWGGYQVAHLVTRTRMFAAAVSGAPVSNMTSAYGGIRWGSGMSRQWQYERSQSRIGGTLWEALPLYVENSPLFFAEEIETPVLILHNDEDGAVPWYQGIELFMALRRLSKPAWMLNYNDEGHGLRRFAHRRDYAVRMQQFFDHFLKGAPAPRWIEEGVPAIEKGRSLGLEPAGASRRAW